MVGAPRRLWVVSVFAIAIAELHCGTSGADGSAPNNASDAAWTTDAPDSTFQIGRPDATDAPRGGICSIGAIAALPICSGETHENAVCDGTVSACRATSDGGPSIFVCQNLADGIALEWTQAISLDTPCTDRTAVSCSPMAGATDQELLDDEVGHILFGCLGNESWLFASFSDGCATMFTISNTQPDRLACVEERLGKERYSCAATVSCGEAFFTTLH